MWKKQQLFPHNVQRLMRFYFQTRSTFHEKRWINLDISHQFQPTTVNDTYVPDRYFIRSDSCRRCNSPVFESDIRRIFCF